MLEIPPPDPQGVYRHIAESRTRTSDFVRLLTELTAAEMRRAHHPETREHLGRMIDLVHTLERLQSGILRAPHEGLAQHLSTAALLWKTIAEPRGIAVDLTCDATLAVPRETVPALALIAHELVTNSLRHAFPNGLTGRVTIRLERATGSGGRLLVVDDGIGLRDPSAGAGRPDGPATGLHVVRRVAAALGAEATLVSGGRSGTEAHVRFPLRG